MTFLAPAFFAAAVAVALGAVALHFIVTRQPASEPLPTARFVPAARVQVTTLARRPEDLLLLLLRVMLVLLVGAAFARPLVTPPRRPLARVILVDRSAAVADPAGAGDSVRRLAGKGDVVLGFDATVHPNAEATDSHGSTPPPSRPDSVAASAPSLSAALVAGIRTGTRLRDAADSVELVIVSPFPREGWDGATAAIRALWPGRIRLIEVPAVRGRPAAAPALAVRAAADDPLVVAVQAAGLAGGDSLVRLVRTAPLAADSAWARSGGVLLHWPAQLDGTPPAPDWRPRAPVDTAGAVTAGDIAVVYPFERRWQAVPRNGVRVVARWIDGEPAAVETDLGAGCTRDMLIPVPSRGDLVLRSDFGRLLATLASPCGAAAAHRGGVRDLAALAGRGPLASRASLPAPEIVATPLVPWLLAAALLLAIAELRVRRRTGLQHPAPPRPRGPAP